MRFPKFLENFHFFFIVGKMEHASPELISACSVNSTRVHRMIITILMYHKCWVLFNSVFSVNRVSASVELALPVFFFPISSQLEENVLLKMQKFFYIRTVICKISQELSIPFIASVRQWH